MNVPITRTTQEITRLTVEVNAKRNPGLLERIALQMTVVAEATPRNVQMPILPYRRTLERGLELTRYNTVDGECVLILGRMKVMPSEGEIAICRRAFRVPEDTEQYAKQSETGKFVVGLRWTPSPPAEGDFKVK